eukprot:TRINITY_DN21189_c0_g1_i1.p1 TRINITY_DN21189_c0_g1~~TRINITY_DN21189_c0_g1_i1.p1  ORF type:complete len:134 (-),score=15.16 TRINITY_DN21189_c0_g1_i1:614-1015(-)
MSLASSLSRWSIISSSSKSLWLCLFCSCSKTPEEKLDPRALKGIFLGYSSTQKGYRCYVLQQGGKYFVTMDVTFFEDVPYYSSTGKSILEPNKHGEPPTLVQDVSPPLYPSSSLSTPLSPTSVPSESQRTMPK